MICHMQRIHNALTRISVLHFSIDYTFWLATYFGLADVDSVQERKQVQDQTCGYNQCVHLETRSAL